jgi:hypothetical protein
MIFCLPKHLVDDFLNRLKTGEITPEKLSTMTSAERNTYFTSFLGAANASKVNALFESKLLLKNQQQGIINWAKQVTGIKPAVKRDILSRVEKMTQILQPKDMDSFLSDLAAQRLGIGVTMEEAGKIADLAKSVSEKKALIPEDAPVGSKERMDYGTALVVFKDYVGNLKMEAKKPTAKELLTNPSELLYQIGGTAKSILSSMDNSFFGRQGFIALVNQPDIWASNFAKSWGDMGKELKGIDAMLPIKADVFSRPNAINGKYKAMQLDIGLESEEAFPSQLPEKIPLLGRLFKASESAYNGAALRFRVDIADRLIAEAEAMGVDVMDKDTGLGTLVNSMTGRGAVKLLPGQSKLINATIFSIRYLKSNFDVLTAHAFDKKVGSFARKKAAQNILKVIGAIGSILAIAKLLDPDSVELDPRSSNFGKIMVGRKREIKINVSLGMGAIITLAARIFPFTTHNGKFSNWIKNSRGRYVDLRAGKYGIGDASTVLFDFFKGKAAPLSRLLLNYWKGSNFQGEKFTARKATQEMVTPIPVENLFDLAKTSAGEKPILFAILTALDLLGVNVNTYQRGRRRRRR